MKRAILPHAGANEQLFSYKVSHLRRKIPVWCNNFHYRAAHPEYAAWTNLWFKILALLLIPAFILIFIVGYELRPMVAKANPIIPACFLSYILGSLLIMLLYRLSVERGFRKTWNDPQWRTNHQKEVSSVDVD